MKAVLMVICVVLLSGCGGPVQTQRIDTASSLQAPFDQVWGAVLHTLSEQRYRAKTIDKASGLLETEWVRHPRGDSTAFTRLASLPNDSVMNSWASTRGRLILRIHRSSSTTTRVRVDARYEALADYPDREWLPCVSTGAKEEEFLAIVRRKVKR